MSTDMSRVLGLLVGFVADRVIPDPASYHPVAGFGRLAASLERLGYAPTRQRGVAYTATLVGGAAVAGLLLERRRPVLGTALATWAVLGGASLEREALAVSELLASGDLPGARQRLTHLVGRDTTSLDEGEVARAVVESVAENTSDAVVSPLVVGALFGVPGLLAYRATNTLDAMVGHRSSRYLEFGWASARLDDLLNLPGARVTAVLAALLGPSPRSALATWARDASAHPSPNAGPVEASFAGALGIRLGGQNTYGDRTEHRAVLGSGRAAEPRDIQRSVELARRVDVGAALVAVLVAVLVAGSRARSSRSTT
ncbi:cobalamin biosynthesis protein [Marmoricola sp. URHB0036]|uniref:cobalamin biosynthesis protein n=1 Tax=Marmoricola sp. URHB0036 TaxID=1298863 RepID=UPI0003F6CC49|nr:cobalamin biosynthesis protein [Marmoricola sp. URHB0036]